MAFGVDAFENPMRPGPTVQRDPIGRTPDQVQQEYDEIGAHQRRGAFTAPTPTAGSRGGGSAPSVSGNLEGGLGALGLSVTGVGGGYVDAEDLPVFLGTTDSKGRKRRSDPVVQSSYAYLAPYRWQGSDLEAFQRRLYNAGLLGDDESAVAWGTVDGLTERAWRGLVDTAANYYAAGKKLTPQQVLDQIGIVGVGGTGRDRQPLTVQLSDPETVKFLMREAAKEALGAGKIDDEKLDAIVARWHAQERNAQTAAYNAEETGGTVIQPPGQAEFKVFADTELKRIDPAAYDAHKVLDKFSTMLDVLGGRNVNA